VNTVMKFMFACNQWGSLCSRAAVVVCQTARVTALIVLSTCFIERIKHKFLL